MQTSKNYEPSGSTLLNKLMAILECFSAQDPLLSVSEISKRTGINNSSIYRYISMLCDQGLLERDPEIGKYTIGLHVVELAGISLSRLEVRRHGQSELDMLCKETHLNANLAMLYEGDSFHISFSLQTEVERLYTVIGRRTAAHMTALGKAIYAFMPLSEVHAIINRYGWRTKRTEYSIDTFEQLDEELEDIRRQGVAIDRSESALGTWCVAAPVFQRGGQVVAAMSVSGSEAQVRQELESIQERVTMHALQLSYKLGYYKG